MSSVRLRPSVHNMKDQSPSSSPALLLPGSEVSSIDIVEPSKPGWSKKRKIWNAAVVLLAISVIIVAVVVPVVLTRRSSRASYSYRELYFPQGYNGTSLNGVLGGSRHQNRTYDRLVV